MHISQRDRTYTAQHCTGPTHNMLRLTVGRGEPQSFNIKVLPPIGECRHHGGLTTAEVKLAIEAGLTEANTVLQSQFNIVAAEIVENDTRQRGIYEYLTLKIIERAAESEGSNE